MPYHRSDLTALRWDVLLYAGCAVFAAGLGAASTLATHRAWAAVAMTGYAVAGVAGSGMLLAAGCAAPRLAGVAARAALTGAAWLATAVGPMVWLALHRAHHGGAAQEEVRVVEHSGLRWWETGTPYLSRDGIAALPAAEQLTAYTPYQPVMAVFGLPRAFDPTGAWWSDARVWFTLATAAALAGAVAVSRGVSRPVQLRAVQAATVLPTAALATAVGGDDLPVLAGCLLALALAARGRMAAAGVAAGAAAALKLVAWPVVVVLAVHAATRDRDVLGRYAAGAFGVPVLTLLPSLLRDPGAVVENTVRFPLGAGLVSSPAEAPLPGYLIATWLPGGRAVATGALLAAGLAVTVWLLRRPPATAAAAAWVTACGLLAAVALLPATRFGYLLYPLALLAWVPALRPVPTPKETTADDPLPCDHERLPAPAGGHRDLRVRADHSLPARPGGGVHLPRARR